MLRASRSLRCVSPVLLSVLAMPRLGRMIHGHRVDANPQSPDTLGPHLQRRQLFRVVNLVDRTLFAPKHVHILCVSVPPLPCIDSAGRTIHSFPTLFGC